MIACPQCNASLPDDARNCNCCGKAFLTVSKQRETSAIRQATEKLKAKAGPGASAPHEPVDYGEIATYAMLGIFLLLIVRQVTMAGPAQTRANPYVDAKGRGKIQQELEGPKDSDVVLESTKLTGRKGALQVVGSVTNRSRYLLWEATVRISFSLPNGRHAGNFSGRILRLEPGASGIFAIPVEPHAEGRELRMLSWHSSLTSLSWGRDVAP